MADQYGLVSADGTEWDAATVRQLRENVIEIRNESLGPKVFNAAAAVALSHTISLMDVLATAMDEYAGKKAAEQS